MSGQRPNILWLCTDQQRWDTVHRLGNPHIATPAVDSLAGGGVGFRRAYTPSPICTPARASMMTGRYPASHCVYRNGNAFFPPDEKLVTRILADAGYDCGLVGKLHLSASKDYERRADDGYRYYKWSHYALPDSAISDDYESWLRFDQRVDPEELYRTFNVFCGPGVPAALSQTTWCGEMALRFVEDRRTMPWMLSVNFFDPHAPFDAPPEFLSQIDPNTLPFPLWRDSDAERWRDFVNVDQQMVEPRDPRIRPVPGAASNDDPDHPPFHLSVPNQFDALAVKANYYAMVQQIDAQVARLLEALRRTGQLDNTLVLFHSDHGELLGDHGLMLKGCRFFDGLVRVPMVWSWPGRFQPGLESEALVDLVDIAPTLLDVLGIEQPWQMQGLSLLPILEGRADPHRHKPYVVSEFRDSIAAKHGSHGSMVFDGRWKSVVYHGQPVGEIFDQQTDPGEFDNLWFDTTLRAERLKFHLDALVGTVSGGPPRIVAY